MGYNGLYDQTNINQDFLLLYFFRFVYIVTQKQIEQDLIGSTKIVMADVSPGSATVVPDDDLLEITSEVEGHRWLASGHQPSEMIGKSVLASKYSLVGGLELFYFPIYWE